MPGFSSLRTRSAESQEKVCCESASSTAQQKKREKEKKNQSTRVNKKSTASPFRVDCSNIWADHVATAREITVVVSSSAFLGKGVGKTTSMLILKVSSFSQTAAEEVTG